MKHYHTSSIESQSRLVFSLRCGILHFNTITRSYSSILACTQNGMFRDGQEIDGTQYWTMWNRNNRVPASCCGSKAKPTSAAYYCNRYEDPNIKKMPCYPSLVTWLEYSIWGLVGALGGLIVLNFCVMFGAKWLKNKDVDDDSYLYTRYNNHDTSSSFTEKTRETNDTGFNSTWL